MTAFELGLWYLYALAVVGVGVHVLQRLVSRYSAIADKDIEAEGEGE
jgi:hypothetical protein